MMRHPLRWWTLAVMILAVLVDMVDNQIVTVALPTIERGLNAGDAALQWISAGYALGFALTLVTGGRLGDRYGRKRLFVLGMGVFTVASLVAGLAPRVDVLIAARVVQGIGAGLMVPQVLSFIRVEFDDLERRQAMVYYGAAFPVGGLAGPLLGGVITQADLFGAGWRAIFLVNLPIGLFAVAGVLLTMPTRSREPGPAIDAVGVGLLTVALFAVFFPLVQGRELGWPAWLVGMLVAALSLLWLFARQQRALARHGGEPLIPPALLRRSMVAGQAVMFTVNTAIGVFFVLTLHLQLGLGYSPLGAAMVFLPATLGIVMGNILAARLAARTGRRFITLAVMLLALSLGSIAVLVVRAGANLNAPELFLPALGFGVSIGAALNSLFNMSLAEVGPTLAGTASGLVNTTIQLGTATGIALFGTVFFSRLDGGFVAATAGAIAVSVGVLVLALALTAMLPRVRPGTSSATRDRASTR